PAIQVAEDLRDIIAGEHIALALRHRASARAAAHHQKRHDDCARHPARSNAAHRVSNRSQCGFFLSVKKRLPPSEPSRSSGMRRKFPPGLYCGSSVIQEYARPVAETPLTA